MKVKKYNILISIILMILCFQSCMVSIKKPQWVEIRTRGYELEGIGFSTFDKNKEDTLKPARDAAFNDAIAKLALRLNVHIKGKIVVDRDTRRDTVSGKEINKEAVKNIMEVLYDTVLGKKYFDEFQDKDEQIWWCIVWITKEDMKTVVDRSLDLLQKYLSLATKNEENNISVALNYYKCIKEILEDIKISQSIYPERDNEINSFRSILTERCNLITNKIIALLEEINLEKGNIDEWANQVLDFGVTLKKPLIVKVRSKLNKNIPLIFKFNAGEGDLLKEKMVVMNSVVENYLIRVNSVLKSNKISVQIDIEQLLGLTTNSDKFYNDLIELGLNAQCKKIKKLIEEKQIEFIFSSRFLSSYHLKNNLNVKWLKVVSPDKPNERYQPLFNEGDVFIGDRICFEVQDIPYGWKVYYFNIDPHGKIWYVKDFSAYKSVKIDTIDTTTEKQKVDLGWWSIFLVATDELLSIKQGEIEKFGVEQMLKELSIKKEPLTELFTFCVKKDADL